MNSQNNPPAFPGFAFTPGMGCTRTNERTGEPEAYEPGMNLLDWFASQIISAAVLRGGLSESTALVYKSAAAEAYAIATAMLAARESNPPTK